MRNGEVFPLDIVLYDVFKSHGMKLRNRIVWRFGHGLHCTKRFSGRYETILWFTKSDDYYFDIDPIRVPSKYPGKKYFKGPKRGKRSGNPLGKNPSDVWDIPNVKANHVEKTTHPCQFPVELVERLVLSMTEPGTSVLDPYMGVGSSLVAARKHGRAAFGCDVVAEYVEIARQRVQELDAGVLRTRPMHKPIYDPYLPGAVIRRRTYRGRSKSNTSSWAGRRSRPCKNGRTSAERSSHEIAAKQRAVASRHLPVAERSSPWSNLGPWRNAADSIARFGAGHSGSLRYHAKSYTSRPLANGRRRTA